MKDPSLKMFRKPSECGGAPRIENKYISRYGMNNDPRFIATYEKFAHQARENRIYQYNKRIIILQVKNLDVRVTEEEMYKLFKICGQITSHQLHLSEGGDHKHGFIVYLFINEARKAINKFHGMTFKR